MSKVRFGFGAFGFLAMLMAVGCGDKAPTAPSSMAVAVTSPDATAATTSYPVVTLQADLTVSPAYVTVPAGSKVRMVNSTTRPTQIQSSNCWEFGFMALPAGYAKNTQAFSPAGKTCDYWAMNSGQKIFVGRVVVQ